MFIGNDQGKIKAHTQSSMRWFRFYNDALDDPKVQRLAPHLFKTWINLLCLASKDQGALPSDDDIAFRLRISVADAAQQVSDLILAGLIDLLPDGSRTPHNWTERQYPSDTSAARMRKHRKSKKKKPSDTACDVTCDASDAKSDGLDKRREEKIREEEKIETPVPTISRAKPKRGTRLADDWVLPKTWGDWTLTNCPLSTPETVRVEATKFANYWQSKGGQNACKVDWFKTWQNRCLDVFGTAPVRPRSQAYGHTPSHLTKLLAKRRTDSEAMQ
jgi:hypothetical protein